MTEGVMLRWKGGVTYQPTLQFPLGPRPQGLWVCVLWGHKSHFGDSPNLWGQSHVPIKRSCGCADA